MVVSAARESAAALLATQTVAAQGGPWKRWQQVANERAFSWVLWTAGALSLSLTSSVLQVSQAQVVSSNVRTLSAPQLAASVAARCVSDIALRYALFAGLSGWAADRLAGSGALDSAYLASGVEVSVRCGVCACEGRRAH